MEAEKASGMTLSLPSKARRRLSAYAAGAVTAAVALSGCAFVHSNCGEKEIPAAEVAAVRDILELNGLEKEYPPNRIASQDDVEGCPTDHIRQITATGIGLDTIPPSIAALTGLYDLMLGRNRLRSLPKEVTALNPLSVVVTGNALCEVPSEIATWLTKHQPGWDSSQTCP
jgi:hypothetical protein